MVSTRAIFTAPRGAVIIPATSSIKPGCERLTPKGTDVRPPAFAWSYDRSSPNARDARRPYSSHLSRSERINLMPGKHSRTGETLNSNLDGNHD